MNLSFAENLLVVTGFPFLHGQKSEVIDLSDLNSTCQLLEDFPDFASGATGDLIQNQFPLICGGWNYGAFNDKCFFIGSNNTNIINLTQLRLIFWIIFLEDLAINCNDVD